jgi:hypothetical protein
MNVLCLFGCGKVHNKVEIRQVERERERELQDKQKKRINNKTIYKKYKKK